MEIKPIKIVAELCITLRKIEALLMNELNTKEDERQNVLLITLIDKSILRFGLSQSIELDVLR